MSKGKHVPGSYMVLGCDGVGKVVKLGSKATSFKVGDTVFFAGDGGRQGTYAQFIAVDERIIAHVPETLSQRDVAGVPMCALTAWELLIDNMDVNPIAALPSLPQESRCSCWKCYTYQVAYNHYHSKADPMHAHPELEEDAKKR